MRLNALRQRGGTMIEALIAILILSFSLLGLVGLQNAAVAYQRVAAQQVLATGLVSTLGELARSNPAGFSAGGFNWVQEYGGALPPELDCSVPTACSSADNAKVELRRWLQTVRAALPAGDANVVAGTDRTIDVWVMWRPSQAAGQVSTRGTCRAAAIAAAQDADSIYCVFARIRT